MVGLEALSSVLLAALLGFAVFRLVRDYGRTGVRHAPLPPSGYGVPLIGDTFRFISEGATSGRRHHERLGDIYRSWFLGERIIHIGDLASAKKILNAEHELVEGQWPWVIRRLLGPRSISTTYGQYHTQLRKVLNPHFTPKAVAAYTTRLVELAQQTCNEMADAAKPKGEDAMKKFTFKVATEMILGFEPSATSDDRVARLQSRFNDWVEGLLSLPINLPGFTFHKAMQARKVILAEYHDNITRLVKRASGDEATSILELYVRAVMSSDEFDKDVFDMEHFANSALNLLFAGHDTSASVLMMLLRLLKLSSQTLQKLREEQSKVMAEHGKELDNNAVASMPYAEATVKEAMRIEPIVTVLSRVALKTFEVGGYTIPKGQKIQIELWKLFEEDPRWIKADNPELAPTNFNPDRWLSEEGRRTGSFIPFGSGSRMCTGYNFAMLEIKIMLAVLAREYEWEIDLNEPVKTFPLPVLAWGMPMTFKRLQRPVTASEE
ncbi:hypothetical protein ABBQ38_011847 [Trebouxia sp. C0009 RCD-2024]